jgi:hypothetical protein
LSDALCRLSTGGGFSTRTLYTDLDETVFAVKRPTILTAIEEIAVRGDLLDRAIIIYLPPVPEAKRLKETELLRVYEEMKPRLLGALFDRVSAALANLSDIRLKTVPRLADFAYWVTASEPVSKRGEFVRLYSENRSQTNELPLETPLADAIRKLSLPWQGTASELLSALEAFVGERTKKMKSWPASGRSVSNKLRSLAPNLRHIGISVEFWRDTGKARSRFITLSGDMCNPSSVSSGSSDAQPEANVINDLAWDDLSDEGGRSDFHRPSYRPPVSHSKQSSADEADEADDKKHASMEGVSDGDWEDL